MQRLTKIDAARRQLDAAIRLWLGEDDLAAVHTLAYAATTILRDLGRHAKPPVELTSIGSYALDRDTACFLKHANNDPDAWMLDIDATIPEFVFYRAMWLYESLGNEPTQPMLAAKFVIDLKYRFYLDEEKRERQREEERERERRYEDMDEDERAEQFSHDNRTERLRHTAMMEIGRKMLAGQPLFE